MRASWFSLALLLLAGCRAATQTPAATPKTCPTQAQVAQRLGARPGTDSALWCTQPVCDSPAQTLALVAQTGTAPAVPGWTEGTPATPESRASLEAAARVYSAVCAPAEAEALTGQLVAFPTVSARKNPADDPAFVAMAAHLQAWSQAEGFEFEATPDNGAWVVSTHHGEPSLAFVMHADVVPIDAEGDEPVAQGSLPTGWTHAPFEMHVTEDRLYGRGTEDDKGPIAAVLVTLRTLRRFGLLPQGQVQAIMGTGEESDWSGMKAFVASRKQAPHVISLDASYPVVIAESGFVAWSLHVPVTSQKRNETCIVADAVEAGQFLTQVPGDGRLLMQKQPGLAQAAETAAKAALVALNDPRLSFEVEDKDKTVELRVKGDAVHSSEADNGANAMWLLAKAGAQLDLCPGAIRSTLGLIDTHLVSDHWGRRLQLAYEHPVMGKLLVVPTVLRSDASQVTLRINMRRPAGLDSAAFSTKLDTALKRMQMDVPALVEATKEGRYVGEPALVDPDSELVTTLMQIYREASGDSQAQPQSIRGGTYARLFEGAVSFGPNIPGRTYRGHAPDEYLEKQALQLMLTTSLEAVLRLAR